MGNRPTKISCAPPPQGNQRAENDGEPISPSAGESSSRKVPATVQAHGAEVVIVHVAPTEGEVYILVPPEEMEGERPQENFEQSGERPSIAMTSGSSEAASGILEEAESAPELADSATEASVRTDVQPVGLDLPCEASQLLLPVRSPEPPPKTREASSPAEQTSDCFAVSEEEVAAELGTRSVGMTEPRKGAKDLHPDLSKGTEVPESDQKVSCEMDPELLTSNAQGAAEEQATRQRELDEAASEEALRRIAEPHPDLILAETLGRPSVIMAALADEQLAEGQTDPQNHLSLSVSEVEGEIPEESSAVGTLKEREDLCSPAEVSVETELQPNDQKVPYGTCLELTTQVAAEEPATEQRQLDDEASPERAVDTDSHLDVAVVETSGGTSGMGAAPGTEQLAEEQSIPGHDLPLAVTEMEGKLSGDGSVAGNVGEMTQALSSEPKVLPVEAQDKVPAQGEAGNETASPIESGTPLEKELQRTLTTQSVSTVEEKPNSDAQLCGDAEFLDVTQPDAASPVSEAMLPGAHTAAQAPPAAEVTTAPPSPEALLGTAETVKELEEASPDRPLAEETIEQAGSPEAPSPPETAPLSGTPLLVAHGEEEEEEEFVDASTCEATEVQGWAGVLGAQDQHDGNDEPRQESPVGSPKLITVEAEGETLAHADADAAEASKVEDSRLQHSGPRYGSGSSAPQV